MKIPTQAVLRGSAMLLAVSSVLAGCSSTSTSGPVSWWHRQEGGKIAEQRPPPPGANQPFPNMASVPAKPETPDAEALKKLTASLVADRTNAQHAAQSAPLTDPSSPTASPSLFGVGTAPPPPPPSASTPASPSASTPASGSAAPGPQVASASMPAVTAPPAPPAPAAAPSAAPRKAVETAALDTPAAATPAAATPDAGPPPALPAVPPERPPAAGPAPVVPVAPQPMPGPSTGQSATIVFVEGASNLSQPATDEVKAFAAKRGNGTIAVTGYGDSPSSDPDAQSAALTLGLARAQSIFDALKQDGVPATAIRVGAEASGSGALLHLLQ